MILDNSSDAVFAELTVQYTALHSLGEDGPWRDDVVEEFADTCEPLAIHPYVRELLHSLTLKMNITPLLLDVSKAPLHDLGAAP